MNNPEIYINVINNSDNFSLWSYIQNRRGPQQQPLETAIPLTVVNVLIFVSGLLGNIAVCIVIIKHPSMHTATNYYLFNLAISDLTLLIFGLPNDVAIYWHQYPWTLGVSFCKLRALLSEMASYVSVLTIVSFSTERYLAICYPLYLYTMSGLQRAIRIIVCLWVVAFLSALPFSVYSGVDYLVYPPNSTNILQDSAYCGMLTQPEGIPLTEISTLVFFIIPMLAIAVQYTRMAFKISQTAQRRLGTNIKGSVHRRAQSNRIVIRMLSAVVIAFFVCWAPFHAQRLLVIYGSETKYFQEINTWMYFVTGIFYYFSSTLNPILYNVMSERMRNSFKEIIFGCRPKVTLTRNSTYRDTTLSYNIRVVQQQQQQRLPSHVDSPLVLMHDEIDEEKIHLMTSDMVTTRLNADDNNGNAFIYERQEQKKAKDTTISCSDSKANGETFI